MIEGYGGLSGPDDDGKTTMADQKLPEESCLAPQSVASDFDEKLVKVTQADRDAAWNARPESYRYRIGREMEEEVRRNWDMGVYDETPHIQSYARHRITALSDDKLTSEVIEAGLKAWRSSLGRKSSFPTAMKSAAHAMLAKMRGEENLPLTDVQRNALAYHKEHGIDDVG